MRIHLDTDLGGDTDDVCVLAMLLGWPGVEVVGITTAPDSGGRRAGYVAHCLELAGRDDIPVAAGAAASLTTLGLAEPVVDDERSPSRHTCAPRTSRDSAHAARSASCSPYRARPTARTGTCPRWAEPIRACPTTY